MNSISKEVPLTALSSNHLNTALVQVPPIESDDRRSIHYALICTVTLLAADCASITAAASVASFITSPWPQFQALNPLAGLRPQLDFIILFSGIISFLMIRGRYSERIPCWTETRLVIWATFCAACAEIFLGLLTNNVLASIPLLVTLLAFAVLAALGNRLAKHWLSLAGIWTLPVVVIGDDMGAVETALNSDPTLGYRVLCRIDPKPVLDSPARNRLRSILNRFNARRLLIAIGGDWQREVIACALRERVPFSIVQPFAFSVFPSEPTALFSHDALLMRFHDGLSRPFARAAKVAFDISVSAFLLVVASPLFLIVTMLVRQDGGDALFAHQRIGAQGRQFGCLKFRTMVVDSERVLEEVFARDPALAAEWVAKHKLTDDPRITAIGRFLRRTSLDELPQLFNVLRLEMSLVGPRPIVEDEVPFYGEDIAHYYATRPGLTGLWQVSGRSDTSYARRVQLDTWYVNNWTMWHDFVILLKTIPAVLRCRGAR
jgi:undecaprenyl-phosphate galactose phosphotransferase